MKVSERKLRLKEIEEKAERALIKPLDIEALKDIVDQLLTFPNKDRDYFKDFVNGFLQKLFDNNVNVSGTDRLDTIYNKKITRDTKKLQDAKNMNFAEALWKLKDLIPLRNLKNHFLVKLQNEGDSKYEHLILYDKSYFIEPLKGLLKEELPPENFIELSVAKSIIEARANSNFICLILTSPRINEPTSFQKLKENLENVLELYDGFGHITIKDPPVQGLRDFYIETNNREEFLDELKYVTGIFLTNSELNFEEEKTIKKLFQNLAVTPVLEFKLLKGGKSDSKVVEITPKRRSADSKGKRYVIKLDSNKSKIKKEIENFRNYVEDFGDLVLKYSMHSDSSVNYEALRYRYASSGKFTNSYTLADILDFKIDKFNDKVTELTSDVFKEKCFQTWSTEVKSEKIKIGSHYKHYIKKDATNQSIALIKGITTEEVQASEFCKKFDRILESEIQTKIKICHGDLHSGNYMIDEIGDTFLIDFAFTEERQAVIDHATLECSIKFNHIPRYLEVEDLLRVEREFLGNESFYKTFEMSIDREDLRTYYKIINNIRFDALNYIDDDNSRLEYFISLLMITYRQINYSELNQLFALRSAELILDHIDGLL